MKPTVREIAVFGVLGALMFALDIAMEALPNIHLVGVFIIAATAVYRQKALYPLYVYVILTGLYAGFSLWWIPYLYVWTVLWGVTMLLPKKMPKWLAPMVYVAVCGLHGLAFGVLYAPSQALLFGMNGQQTLAWIAAGLPFDVIHAIGNVVCGLLICPIILILRKTKEPIS
ncbi:MAG: hypothetical protein J6R33_05035 [Clostridia bacterium]|nr:hypothetical protein [Clostridia bacterium]